MPEFTYEESDNYMAAMEAAGMSDGALKKEYFTVLRMLKNKDSGILNTNYSLWLSILETEMEKRGIMKDRRVINVKKP